MEFRQFNNGGGVTTGGITMGGGRYGPDGWMTGTLTSSDQWSNLKNKLIFVLESCI